MKKIETKTVLLVFLFLIICSSGISAQEKQPEDVAPLPEKIISKGEKEQLEKITGVKERTNLSISLMENRLAKAETLVQEPNFSQALSEIGSYQALLEEVFNFLYVNDFNSDKVKNNLKRLEIILRKHITRLELIRREMSFKYGWHIGNLIKFVREKRAQAVEPLFGEVVKG